MIKRAFQLSLIFVIFFCALFSMSANAWSAAGHMIIANIAYQHLTPTVKAKVDSMLAYMNVEDTSEHKYVYTLPSKTFMAVATWPDNIKEEDYKVFSAWHFDAKYFSADGTPVPQCNNPENVVWAINDIQSEITSKYANPYDKSRALTFLIHFVGDVHQPMHNVSRVSKEHPYGDEGGNEYPISYTEANGAVIKDLHELWDTALNLYPQHGVPYNTENLQDIQKLADDIQKDYPESYFGNQVNDLNPKDWSDNSYTIARNFAYTVPQNTVPTAAYIAAGSTDAEKRIALGGYHLANLLNKMLS